jgi:hypothetical protein
MKITIKNWARFQHFKDRRPPWIKLYRELLDDRQWHDLPPECAKLLVECWLLASEQHVEGIITGDIEDIAFRLHRTAAEVWPLLQAVALQGFIDISSDDDINVISARYQDDAPETETETEKKQTRRKRRVYPSEFNSLWDIHRRGPKAKAHDEWRRAVGGVITQGELVKALRGYVATLTPDFQGVHLFRYIKDQRWEEGGGEVPGVLKRNIITSAPMKVMS